MAVRSVFIFLCCLGLIGAFQQEANAQYHLPVYSDLEGQSLIDKLVMDFKPGIVLDYSRARDTMFSNIYRRNDSLSCVYTGHRLYMNPALDPTDAVFMNGADNGINTEHTWPQSLGAGLGFARSNMHHLFPTRVRVNADRGSFPFGEIEDSQTDKWYYKNQSQNSIPSQNIERYSEKINGRFEPREDHKGNVARAIFYFYTIYHTEATSVNANFFEQQRSTLCQWHLDDPVDELEWRRNLLIAKYQDDKANPFILDCTLPERSYCSDFGMVCQPTATGTSNYPLANFQFKAFPNPFYGETLLEYELKEAGSVQIEIFDAFGQKIAEWPAEKRAAGLHTQLLALGDGMTTALYYARVTVITANGHFQGLTKLLQQAR